MRAFYPKRIPYLDGPTTKSMVFSFCPSTEVARRYSSDSSAEARSRGIGSDAVVEGRARALAAAASTELIGLAMLHRPSLPSGSLRPGCTALERGARPAIRHRRLNPPACPGGRISALVFSLTSGINGRSRESVPRRNLVREARASVKDRAQRRVSIAVAVAIKPHPLLGGSTRLGIMRRSDPTGGRVRRYAARACTCELFCLGVRGLGPSRGGVVCRPGGAVDRRGRDGSNDGHGGSLSGVKLGSKRSPLSGET